LPVGRQIRSANLTRRRLRRTRHHRHLFEHRHNL